MNVFEVELRLIKTLYQRKSLKHIIIFLLLLFPAAEVFSAPDILFPRIEALNYSDLNYRQLQEDIEFYYRAAGSGKQLPPLLFYTYTVRVNENIFSLASQAGLPYDTVASLNRIASSSADMEGRTILIPSQAGLYIPHNPETDLEYIALSWRQGSPDSEIKLNKQSFYYFPGETYHEIERAYFLGILFTNPLPEGVVSSGYGMRESPFTGKNRFHNGIDIAAPSKTSVYAAREGEIIDTGYNETYGNFIEIQHAGGYSTFYGHLNKFFVELHDKVISTMIIAEVGTTGRSTGPHLHFEIRRNGRTRDPAAMTPGLD